MSATETLLPSTLGLDIQSALTGAVTNNFQTDFTTDTTSDTFAAYLAPLLNAPDVQVQPEFSRQLSMSLSQNTNAASFVEPPIRTLQPIQLAELTTQIAGNAEASAPAQSPSITTDEALRTVEQSQSIPRTSGQAGLSTEPSANPDDVATNQSLKDTAKTSSVEKVTLAEDSNIQKAQLNDTSPVSSANQASTIKKSEIASNQIQLQPATEQALPNQQKVTQAFENLLEQASKTNQLKSSEIQSVAQSSEVADPLFEVQPVNTPSVQLRERPSDAGFLKISAQLPTGGVELSTEVKSQFEKQTISHLKELVMRGQYEAEIAIDPPELGAIQVKIQQGADKLQIQMQATENQTADLIRETENALKDALSQETGLGVDLGFQKESGETSDEQAHIHQEAELHAQDESTQTIKQKSDHQVDYFA